MDSSCPVSVSASYKLGWSRNEVKTNPQGNDACGVRGLCPLNPPTKFKDWVLRKAFLRFISGRVQEVHPFLPVRRYFHVQFQPHPCAQNVLHVHPRRGANALQHATPLP